MNSIAHESLRRSGLALVSITSLIDSLPGLTPFRPCCGIPPGFGSWGAS